jgi:pimeloyl-ACP methyl ester carboxylesterase
MKRCGTIAAILLLAAMVVGGCRVEIGEGDKAWNDLVKDHRRDVSVGDYSLHTITMGRGEPVVMVHGFADSTYCFHENLRPLVEAGFACTLIDQPALGRSEIPPEPYTYSIENQAAGVLRAVDALGIDKFAAVGSSMGGGIALYLAFTHPERVTKVIALDPAAYRFDHEKMGAVMRRPGLPDFAGSFAGKWAGYIALWDVYHDASLVDATLVDEYARPMNKPGYAKALIHLLREYQSAEYDRMARNYWKVETPALLVWGRSDTWVPTKFGPWLDDQLPNSRLEMIAEAGHLPHQEQPDVVNPLMISFLKNGL